MTFLSKERIQEFRAHFENFGSSEMDAAPLVETALMAHELLEALEDASHIVDDYCDEEMFADLRSQWATLIAQGRES